MRLALGSDHAGFELKKQLAVYLAELGHGVVDMGTHSAEPVDYPDVAEGVAMAVTRAPSTNTSMSSVSTPW